MLKGAISALVLPFKNGHIDEEAYREFIEWQIEQGIDGLVPCGTTGESATLSHEEHEKAIRICIEQAKKRVPVIAGCGSNNTAEAVRLTQFAKSAGADAALLISPYYNKPTQEGIFLHYQAVSREVSFPFLVYNVPGRTGSNVTAETMARMYHQIPDMIGVKEATGNLVQISNMLEKQMKILFFYPEMIPRCLRRSLLAEKAQFPSLQTSCRKKCMNFARHGKKETRTRQNACIIIWNR